MDWDDVQSKFYSRHLTEYHGGVKKHILWFILFFSIKVVEHTIIAKSIDFLQHAFLSRAFFYAQLNASTLDEEYLLVYVVKDDP